MAILVIQKIWIFGFGSVGLTKSDFLHPTNVIQLGHEPLRIDILMELEKCNFEECYQRKTQISIGDVTVDFLNIDDLITVKKQAGRLQDLADADNLEKLKNKKK